MRLLASLVLVLLLVAGARHLGALESIKEIHPGACALAVGFYAVACVLNSGRWQMLLQSVGIREGLGTLTALYLIGQFFSVFLPTSAGGDAVRIYEVARRSHRPAQAIVATLQERLLGLGAGLLVGLGATLYYLPVVPPKVRLWILPALVVVTAGIMLLLFPGSLLTAFRRVAGRALGIHPARCRLLEYRLVARVCRVLRPVTELPPLRPARFMFQFGLAMGSAFLGIGMYYVLGQSLQIDVGFPAYCLVVPLVAIMRMLPLLPNGVGVGEVSFVFLMGLFKVPESKALALALAMLALWTSLSLSGGAVLAFRLVRGTWNGMRPSIPDFRSPDETVITPKTANSSPSATVSTSGDKGGDSLIII